MKCNIRVTTLRRLENLAKQKLTTSADSCSRPILVELQSNTERINVLRATRNFKGTKLSKIFLTKWLSNEDHNKEELIHDKYYKFNQAHTPVADEKKRVVVIDGQIRQLHLNGKKKIFRKKSIRIRCWLRMLPMS